MKQLLLILIAVVAVSCNKTAKKGEAAAPVIQPQEQAQTATAPISLTKAEFLKKVVDYESNAKEFIYLGDKPCVIDFYATWCGPCKMIAPVLEELASAYAGQIYVYKIDVDKEGELANAFGIRSIPTLLFVPMKGKPELISGLMSKDELVQKIEGMLGKQQAVAGN